MKKIKNAIARLLNAFAEKIIQGDTAAIPEPPLQCLGFFQAKIIDTHLLVITAQQQYILPVHNIKGNINAIIPAVNNIPDDKEKISIRKFDFLQHGSIALQIAMNIGYTINHKDSFPADRGKNKSACRSKPIIWCEWRGSNPHAQRAQDFKSRLSACSNTLARKILYSMIPSFVKIEFKTGLLVWFCRLLKRKCNKFSIYG